MITSERDTAVVGPPVQRRRRCHLLVVASLAVLGAGAAYHGLSSSLASAAPGPAQPSPAETLMIQQSVQPHDANADADVGPGQCEPCVVGLQ